MANDHVGWSGLCRVRRVALLTIALGALSGPAEAAAGTHTIETVFHAFTRRGLPTIQTHSKSGYCYVGSLTINRKDAWRCFVGNYIYDPCFSSSQAPGEVVCPGVDVTKGIEINLTRGLPRKYADSGGPSLSHQPWDVELANGRHFQFGSGASNVIDGKRLNYFCGSSCHFGLWGFPRRRTEPWTILIGPFTAESLPTRRAIRHVWM